MTNPETHGGSEGLSVPISRRRMINWLMGGLAGLATAVLGVPVVGMLFRPLLRSYPRAWRTVGTVTQFSVGSTTEVTFRDPWAEPWAGDVAMRAAWLRRKGEQEFIAFSINCSHLGCPVRWMQETELFMCPCHGGVYYADGSVAAGPPPRGLTRYPVRVRNGQVQVQTAPTPIL
jgi:menaquinol-cytochrome c reductase iron-sulfur subunit